MSCKTRKSNECVEKTYQNKEIDSLHERVVKNIIGKIDLSTSFLDGDGGGGGIRGGDNGD